MRPMKPMHWLKRNEPSGDGRRARAPVGLQHIAIDDDLAFRQRGKVGDRAQRAAHETLNLEGAARLFALRSLPPHALMRGAREHAILGRHPAFAAALEECRHLFLQAGSDKNMRIAEFDEA